MTANRWMDKKKKNSCNGILYSSKISALNLHILGISHEKLMLSEKSKFKEKIKSNIYVNIKPKTKLFLFMYEKWKSLSPVQLFVTPWTIQSMEFSRPECWSE